MSISEEAAFQFLLKDGAKPYRSSGCFIVADPTIKDKPQWEVHLERPVGAQWVHQIDDMKHWMLYGEDNRLIIFDRSSDDPSYRRLPRDQIFREWVSKLNELLPSGHESHPKYALMPSISDGNLRKRYRDALEQAIPGVKVLPEPEMVAEYFRLIEGNLRLVPDVNNHILVVDTGASTANMTIITSRRDQKILDVDAKGAQRDLRLRPIRGDSVEYAGHWVDLKLAKLLDESNPDEEFLRQLEQAKIQVSLGTVTSKSVRASNSGKSRKINRALLELVTAEMWTGLRPLFERVCARLYENQTSTEDTRKKSKERHTLLNVCGPADAHRLIDTVLLAGGSSQLPGFEETMLKTIFPDGHRPTVLRVGDAFPIAAAVGGLAHILQNYDQPRVHGPGKSDPDIFDARFESTLPYPVVLGIKRGRNAETPITLLEPDEEFFDNGGTRTISNLPRFKINSRFRTRLKFGPSDDGSNDIVSRSGESIIRTEPGTMQFTWEPLKEKGTVTSTQVENTRHLWIEVNKREVSGMPSTSYDGPLTREQLGVDGSDDIVFDFGMSKIVAVTASTGSFSLRALERAVQGGLRADIQKIASEHIETAGVEGTEAAASDTTDRVSATFLSHDLPEGRECQRGWDARVSGLEFVRALSKFKDCLREQEPSLAFEDILVVLLGLTVRSIVLLAGPPGCGKSSLVRLIAQILGKKDGDTFHDIAVQAHWSDDSALLGKNGLLKSLINHENGAHLVLLDEFNLTRPEYYLSRIFHSLDTGSHLIAKDEKLASLRVIGTLNIDESSRVPSPKVVDRCFLIELPQVAWGPDMTTAMPNFSKLPRLPGLPEIPSDGVGTDDHISAILSAMQTTVKENSLRHDLLPSRRVLSDISSLLRLYESLGLQERGLLDRNDLVDRLIASRILVKISGAIDQIEPILNALESVVKNREVLKRTCARISLARRQSSLGFVSPWQ